MAFLPLIVVFLCLARSIYAAKCSVMITDDHLKYLDEMMDSQLETTCSKKVKVVDEKQLKGYCYSEAIISHLYDLLQNLKFKPDSKSYNHTQQLISLYNLRVTNCMEEDFVRAEEISKCLRYIDLSPVQILERVKKSFIIFRDFEASDRTCLGEYSLCEDDYDHVTKGPQCACPSPIPPILSGTATQKSLNNLSETRSSPYTSTIPISTGPLTDYTSVTDTQTPQQSSESTEMSSVILTSIPTGVQPLTTTIMDHLHAATPDLLVTGSESPHTKTDIPLSDVEFPKGITESTYAMGFSQTRTIPVYSSIEGLNMYGSYIETFPTTTTVLNKDSSHLKREFTSVTEPPIDALLGTTEISVSQSSVPNIQNHSETSMEPGIESSSSTVTKVRRSVEGVDKTLPVYASTHAQPVLSSDDSATSRHYQTSSIPPTFKSLQREHISPQKNEIRDLGWAASYLFPTMLTTKHTRFEAEMPSPVSESVPSETSFYSKLTGLETGYTHSNNQQHKQNVAALVSKDRENRGTGSIHGVNLLPILETDKQQDGRLNSNLFLVLIPSMLAILLLCGLLYLMYRNRILRQQLNRQVSELPELRPLHSGLEPV